MKVFDLFNDVLPNSKLIEDNSLLEASPPGKYRQPLYCSYHGQLRIVEDAVCQYHLASLDSYCWEKCETEWSIRKHRPPFRPAYRAHMEQKKTRNERAWWALDSNKRIEENVAQRKA